MVLGAFGNEGNPEDTMKKIFETLDSMKRKIEDINA